MEPVTPAAAHPSWFVRTERWTSERMPRGLRLAILVLYAVIAGAGYADASANDSGPFDWFRAQLLGAILILAWFLMIRALDDLEDQAEDDVNHPDRALQRGAVSRRDLHWLVACTVVVQAVTAVATDRALGHDGLGPITAFWLGMAAFLAVVAVDFGMPRALAARPGLRRALRAPASILPLILAFSIGYGAVHLDWVTIAVVAAVAGVVAWYDISRRPSIEGAQA